MSNADELLNSIAEEGVSVQTIDPATEPHIIIGEDRFISVPKELQRIAVQYDHDIETVTFDCPRYWDGHDMSQMRVYINYKTPGKIVGSYPARNVVVDETNENIMHFDWTISGNVTRKDGPLIFLVCVKRSDDEYNEVNHWNSELNTEMYISEGLEASSEDISVQYPDHLLALEEEYRALFSEMKEEMVAVKDELLNLKEAGEFNGATFTPSVSEDGTISWTNDKGLDNPADINVRGATFTPAVSEDGTITWTNDKGKTNPPAVNVRGATFTPSVTESGDLSWSNDKNLENPKTVNIHGYSPTISVADIEGGHRVTLTDVNGSKTVDIIDGIDGKDAVSPTISVDTIDGGHRITITDINGTKSVDVIDGVDGKDGTDGTDGADGVDGVSPTISVEAITGGHRVTITDKNGSTTFDVMNGTNGLDGDGSGDMVRATYDPQGRSTDIFKYVDDAVANVQNAITGEEGQFVVIGADGKPTAKTIPTAEDASM